MHVARQTPQELVIVAGTRWVSAICAGCALATLYFVIARNELKGLFLVAFFLFFSVIMNLHKTFRFNAMERTVRWNGRKAFKAESGEIRFDDITDIGRESTRAGDRGILVYRLTIITAQGAVPMAYAYAADSDGYSGLRGQILAFVKGGATVTARIVP